MLSGTKSKTLSPETSVPCNLQVACCCLMQFSAEKESLVVLENTSLSVKQDSKHNLVAPGVDVVVLIVFCSCPHCCFLFFAFLLLLLFLWVQERFHL